MKSVVWMVLTCSCLLISPALAQEVPPNLTGNWILNEKLSDDFSKLMQEGTGDGQMGREGGKQGGGGRGGGSGGRGGGRGSGGKGGQGGGDNDERQAKAQLRVARARDEYSRLEIFHDGIELNVTNGLDISRLIYTDGRQMNIWTQNGEARATATWQEQILVVQWKTSQDTMSRIRRYTISDGGQRLTVAEARRLPSQDKAIEITMVYDFSP